MFNSIIFGLNKIEYNMSTQNFSYTFTTSKSPEEVFNILIDPKKWWVGFHNKTITGNSEKCTLKYWKKVIDIILSKGEYQSYKKNQNKAIQKFDLVSKL